MIRSIYSGVSGIKNHQVRMDVIGNNISNVNTTGFKAGQANFQDTLYQTIRNAGESTNPAQVGLGTGVSSIGTSMTPGPLQSTGRTLDLGINGSGFFKVTDGINEFYTRDGAFYITQTGDFVNSIGYQVKGDTWDRATAVGSDSPSNTPSGDLVIQGTLADGTRGERVTIVFDGTETLDLDAIIERINSRTDESGVIASADNDRLVLKTVYTGYSEEETLFIDYPASTVLEDLKLAGGNYSPERNNDVPLSIDKVPVSSINILSNGLIIGTDTDGDPLTFGGGNEFARITLSIFNNQDGLERSSQNMFKVSSSSGQGTPGGAGTAGYGTIESAYLEMSNVDLTDQFSSMITTQRGYQASARIVTVSDTMLDELINLKR